MDGRRTSTQHCYRLNHQPGEKTSWILPGKRRSERESELCRSGKRIYLIRKQTSWIFSGKNTQTNVSCPEKDELNFARIFFFFFKCILPRKRRAVLCLEKKTRKKDDLLFAWKNELCFARKKKDKKKRERKQKDDLLFAWKNKTKNDQQCFGTDCLTPQEMTM